MRSIFMAIAFGGVVLAGPISCTTPSSKKVITQERQFSEKHGVIVNAALVALNANDYAKAALILQKELNAQDLSPYERSTIAQLLGSARYELKDYSGAITAFEASIAAGGLLPKEKSSLDLNIAQLMIASGKPVKGAHRLENWIASGHIPKPKHFEYLWQAWSQAKQYDRALPWAEKWFNAAQTKERKHYDTLNFLYAQLGKTKQRQVILEDMARNWPEDKDIKQAISRLKDTE